MQVYSRERTMEAYERVGGFEPVSEENVPFLDLELPEEQTVHVQITPGTKTATFLSLSLT